MLSLVGLTLAGLAAVSDAHWHGGHQGSTSIRPLFTSLSLDTVTPRSVPVKGTIPSWVKFERYLNGFGKYEGKTKNGTEPWHFQHLFDVMPYVLSWKVDNNRVEYAHNVVESRYYDISKKEHPPFRTFMHAVPPMSYAEELKTLANTQDSDTFSVNIIRVGNKTITISDMRGGKEIDTRTMDTVGDFHYADDMDQERTSIITCAHPSQLPGDKYLYNYQTYVLGNLPHLQFNRQHLYRVDTTQTPLRREVMLEVNSSDLRYMHQFANTENFIIFLEWPHVYNVLDIITSSTLLHAMKWKPELGTRVRVIDKRTWKIIKEYTTDPTFAYHLLNFYEEGDNVIVDASIAVCDHGDLPENQGGASCQHMNSFFLETLRDGSFSIPPSPLRRFTIPVRGDALAQNRPVTWTDVNFMNMDLHAIHPQLMGKKHRFMYALGNKDDGAGEWWNAIVKLDMQTNTTTKWLLPDHYPGEVAFLPRPGATSEDDGVLISTVLGGDKKDGTSYMLVLDAKTMTTLATADAPIFLPFQSHGHTCAPIETSPGVIEDRCFWG